MAFVGIFIIKANVTDVIVSQRRHLRYQYFYSNTKFDKIFQEPGKRDPIFCRQGIE